MNLDYDWPVLQYQDNAKNLRKGQFAQHLKNGSDIYEHVLLILSNNSNYRFAMDTAH